MDNMHLPGGGDDRPTEQFWSGTGQPAGHPLPGGPGFTGQPGPEPPDRHYFARDRRRSGRWSIGIALAALLAGGAIAGVALAGGGSPAASAAPAASTAAAASGADSQAAALSAVLSAAGSPMAPSGLDSSGALTGPATAAPAGDSTGGPGTAVQAAVRTCVQSAAAARAAGNLQRAHQIRRACLRPLLRRLALRGVHGELTVRTSSGFRTLAWERGTIQSVSPGHSIVVKAADGTTWTWELVSSTVVRESGSKTTTSALAAGQQVWVGGPLASGARDARLIIIRPQPRPSSSPPASAS